MTTTSASSSTQATDNSTLLAKLNTKTAAAGSAASTQQMSDQFMQLLITQMKNQDPLNPTDNAQVTSQLAQINTVSGLNTVNQSIQSLSTQMMQMQSLQGASLVGRAVVVPGNALNVSSGSATGSFELAGAADTVKVEVLSSAGRVVDTLDLGAETTGTHQFTWKPSSDASTSSGYTFRVTATSGAAAVKATPLTVDQITAVNLNSGSSGSGSSGLTLQLLNGSSVAYSNVRAIGG